LFRGTLHNTESQAEFDIPMLGRFKVFISQKKSWMKEECEAFLSIRPEKILISKNSAENFSNTLKGIVSSIVYYGRSTQYNILLSNQMTVQVFEQNEEHFPQEHIDYDDEVYLYFQKENVVLLEK
ncbi:MAG: TOBE domain-containing protein, partial [Simkaniaceae bacterium]|nr:TOBE domain-containing protein [Simkaniaceae bacterium]